MRINQDVLEILETCEFDGNHMKLTGQLDRGRYVAVNKIIEAVGGKWNRKTGSHVFDTDAFEIIDQILLTGEYSRTKQDLGQFDTPPAIVDMLVKMAEISPAMRVLEPSAGIGNIAHVLLSTGATVVALEIDADRSAKLASAFALPSDQPDISYSARCDFLSVDPATSNGFDRVIMNPPFSKSADIIHVMHAVKFVLPGGKLVSVMSAGVDFRTDRLTDEFRAFVASKMGRFYPLPEGSFKSSGTMVNATVLCLDL